NVKKDHGDAFRVQPVVFKQEPIEIDPQPSASADMIMKDEFVVSGEGYSGSSADVPASVEPTSHVIFPWSAWCPAKN
ncbi:hypothetical protein CEXT_185101, partial [Caerostris extrusa]